MKVLSFKDSGYNRFVKKLNRRAVPQDDLSQTVADIIKEVKENGNKALIQYTEKFDKVKLTSRNLLVSEKEMATAEAQVEDSVKKAIKASRTNIHAFAHKSMRKNWKFKNKQGAEVGERFVPFDRVGVYVPGGKAPLVSTALMTAAFAQAAKVPQILAATPVGPDGTVNPNLLYALKASGATEILKIGGAQGIAAMALGTSSIAPVEKIFGPGNRFVVEAKRQLVGAVSIDLLPGPSEVLVIADSSANPAFIAADLLAQAEHGGDSIVGFITDSKPLMGKVEKELDKQLIHLDRKEYLKKVLTQGTFGLIVPNLEEAVAICNAFAPEHLSLIVKEEDTWLDKVRTAGAIYVGNFAAVAVGDFLAGPSHTLPTGGSGKSFSGIRADQFQRRTSIVRMDQKSVIKSEPIVKEFSRIEGLDAHGASVTIRANWTE